MATVDLPHQTGPIPQTWQARTYVYYNRYPAIKPTITHRSLKSKLCRLGMYTRLMLVGAIFLVIGGVFPLIVSYEMFFKPLITITCNQCQIVGAKPYFEFDYILATVLGVLGFMMPIFVSFIFVHIMRSRTFRHELFD